MTGSVTPGPGRVLVTGAGGALGRRVIPALVASDRVDTVVGVDPRPLRREQHSEKLRLIRADLVGDLLAELVSGADVVVHLAVVPGEPGDRRVRAANRALTANLLSELGSSVRQLVVVSSATVYGAWANNPVPITEAALVRPNPELPYAVDKAELERRVAEWSRAHPRARVGVLRPAVAVAADENSWMGSQMLRAASVEASDRDPGFQFLHLDDLATAVVHVVENELDGVFNVAPDGWLTSEQRRTILGPRPRLRVPAALAGRALDGVGRLAGHPLDSGLAPYTTEWWVVANDALTATGWVPRFGNDDALVAADAAPPWAAMNARQRQYASLSAAGAALAAAGAGAGWVLRRVSR